ncbi:MAG: DUF3141 domain-containing protein, partial [Candidatus Binatia bacterium]|nr:DUF3141 domain-containing protein [Candidatus Binatia bacterium]
VKNLISLTLPLDLSNRAIPVYRLLDAISPQTAKLLTDIYGNCPAWFIKMGFDAMAPVHHAVDKYVHLYRNKEQAGYAEMFDLFERWMNSDVPLAAQVFHETLDNLFRQNTLIQGRFALDGRKVDLKQITVPVLNIIAEHDDVVHPSSSLPFTDLVGSTDAHTLLFPTGHIGVVVSNTSQKKLWPQVGAWLKERDGRWMH